MNRRGRIAVAVAGVLTLGVSACGGGEAPTSATKETAKLEVVSWWTSGSEAAALNTLLAAFRQANPGVEPVNAAVAGGAGSQAIVALAKRLQAGDPPDVWQTFAGKSVQGYAQRGTVRDVSSVFGGLRATMQPTIRQSLMRDGKPYGVPTGAHRSNVLWYNADLLKKAGVSPPGSGYTLDAFKDDLRKVKDSGATALCLGGKDAFTTVELFENILLSSIGITGWQNMTKDSLDWRGTRVRAALTSFGDLLSYADPEASSLTWDEATKKLATGGCAFESMNDSAYGELISGGGPQTFGSTPFPGTGDTFLAVVDVFVAATKAQNAKNALSFLDGISAPSTQIPFSKAKGSVPVLSDIDVSSLPAYQQESSKSLWTLPVLLSIAHGEAMSPAFQEGFYDAVSAYERSRDPAAFADGLQNAVANDKIPQR